MIVQIELKSDEPLLMHNSRLADPLDPIAKGLREKTSLHHSKKTDEVLMEISRLEWTGSLYYDPKIGPYIPGDNILSAIFQGAGTSSKQAPVKRAVKSLELKVPLQYQGPRDPDELYEFVIEHADGPVHPFVFAAIRSINNGKVLRTRPIFRDWSLSTFIYVNTEKVNISVVKKAFESAGEDIGLGDERPRFGLFTPSWKERPDMTLESFIR